MEIRVTQRSLTEATLSGLQRNLNAMQRLQEQLSSGKSISKPSDSPTGTITALQLRSESARTVQYQRNADDATSWLSTADTALSTVLGSLHRLRELVVAGANDSNSEAARTAMAAEVDGLRASLLDVANTRYLNRPVFGGTTSSPDAYDKTTGAYLGDAGAARRTVAPGTTVPVTAQGTVVFGGAGEDVFALAASIANDLRLDPSALSGRLAAIDARTRAVQNHLSSVGSDYNRVDSMRQLQQDRGIAIVNDLQNVEGVDLPRTVMELQMQQVAYQSALGATARVIQPSLLDFLR